jgi:hypothetical protein
MKCANIGDERFVAAVRTVIKLRDSYWANRWDVAAVLDGHPEWVGCPEATDGESVQLPQNLIRAKARRLIRRKLLDGCACGCRGDFEPAKPDASKLSTYEWRPFRTVDRCGNCRASGTTEVRVLVRPGGFGPPIGSLTVTYYPVGFEYRCTACCHGRAHGTGVDGRDLSGCSLSGRLAAPGAGELTPALIRQRGQPPTNGSGLLPRSRR